MNQEDYVPELYHPEMKRQQMLVPQDPYQIQRQENFQRWQLGSDELLEVLEHNLMGEVFDTTLNEGEGGWIQKRQPYMNEKGASQITTFLRPHIDKKIQLSLLDREEIDTISKYLFLDVIQMLTDHYYEWDISIGDLNFIMDIIENHIYIGGFKRALAGATQSAITPTVHHHETVLRREDNEKKGFFSSIFNRKAQQQ